MLYMMQFCHSFDTVLGLSVDYIIVTRHKFKLSPILVSREKQVSTFRRTILRLNDAVTDTQTHTSRAYVLPIKDGLDMFL